MYAADWKSTNKEKVASLIVFFLLRNISSTYVNVEETLDSIIPTVPKWIWNYQTAATPNQKFYSLKQNKSITWKKKCIQEEKNKQLENEIEKLIVDLQHSLHVISHTVCLALFSACHAYCCTPSCWSQERRA